MPTYNSDYTPLQYNVAGNYKYRQTLLTTKQLQVQLALAMNRRWVGPVAPRDFMKDLMPISEEHLKEYDEKRTQVKFRLLPPRATGKDGKKRNNQEKRLYKAFADCVVRHDLSPNMPFFISADKKKKNTDLRPDAGLKYRQQEKEIYPVPATHAYATRSKAALAAAANTARHPKVVAPQPFNWSLDTLIIEFKGSSHDDPFYTEAAIKSHMAKAEPDVAVSFEKPTSPARKVRGQLAMYAREMFNHQQRTHVFQVLVTGRYARLIYIDHSGAIVSERIDYKQQPDVLGEFFWRYNYMTDESRGLDATASRATDGDKELFTSTVAGLLARMDDPTKAQRRLPGAELTLDEEYPVYAMTVHEGVKREGDGESDDVSPQTMELLVQRPIFDAVSPLGRGTRGYIAVAKTPVSKTPIADDDSNNEDEQKVPLFLKDTWRVNHAMLKAESEVYRLLEKYGVTRIPRLICGGDVRTAQGDVQRTICKAWAQRLAETLKIEFADFRIHLHHRLVQRLAYPIESAANSEEMVKAFDRVLAVIEEVYTKVPSKVLHRDLSVGNVMVGDIDDEEVGLLGDWDHAIETELAENYEHQQYRTGTWPFMSIDLLKNPTKAHEILDDLESLFWTLLYAALHRFRHTGTLDADIFNWWRDEYCNDGTPTGRIVGGERKLSALPDIAETIEFDCKPLQALIVSLTTQLYEYYHAINRVKLAQRTVAANPDDELAKEDCQEAYAARDRLHARLSKPSFWRARLQIALKSKEWIDDVSDEPLHPPRTEDQKMQLQEMRTRTSMQSGARPTKRPIVLPDTVDPEEEQEENVEDDAYSSCEEEGDNEGIDNEDLDEVFAPIPQSKTSSAPRDVGPSPPLSPSMEVRAGIPRSSGSLPDHFEDDFARHSVSPTPLKRTHENPDAGGRLSKRYRSDPVPERMLPPVFPIARPRATAGRTGKSRQAPSGEEANNVAAGPSRSRTGLRSQTRAKGGDKVNLRSM